ncbi:hypothetical protein [Kitasatospora herbaricolor]|uniref:hypothetical protein n=1 Tax=Kitasatospora herbaricolor TaxID=68217 RepID=UPI0036DD09B3
MDSFVKKASNPYSTGGGGTTLEHNYGAVLLGHVLTRDPAGELGDGAVPHQLVFQAADLSPVDDFVLIGNDQLGEIGAAIAVRRAPKLIPSQNDSLSLISSFLQALLARWRDVDAGRWRLILATASGCTPAREARDLAEVARGSLSDDAFRTAVSRQRHPQKNRLKQLDAIVEAVSVELGTDVSDSELTWRLLRRLRVRELQLEDSDPGDRTNAVTGLVKHTVDGTNAAASNLFGRLVELSGTFARAGATVDRATLRSELTGLLTPIIALGEAPKPPDPVDVGAVLRGPLARLHLDTAFEDAQEQQSHDPVGAAGVFGSIADRLASTPYSQYALNVRRRQAQALQAAGDSDGRIRVDLDVMVKALQRGDAALASRTIQRLVAEQITGADSLIRTVNALGAIAELELDHRTTLQHVAATVDELQPDDPYGLQAVTLFAEHAVADNDHALLLDRSARLRSFVDAAPADPLWQARLTACLADADDPATPWSVTAARAGREPAAAAALLSARYARHLARSGLPEEALERYDTAVERALRPAGPAFHQDAADWIEAQNLIRVRYGIERTKLADSHLMPAALRAAGNGALLPHPMSARENALAHLARDKSEPDTLQALRRYRLEAVVTGAWQREGEAERLLGAFHLRTGEIHSALPHLMAAGETDTLGSAAAQLPDEPLDLEPGGVAARQSWERVSAFTLAGKAADLLPDEQAVQWMQAALDEVAANRPPTFSGDSTLAAYRSLAGLAWACTDEQAQRYLDFVEPFLDRRPGYASKSDQSHPDVLIAIAARHPELRRRAVEQMCRILDLAPGRMTEIILLNGASLQSDPELVVQLCGPSAQRGNAQAAIALTLVDARAQAADAARHQVRHLITPTQPTPPDLVRPEFVALLAEALDDQDRSELGEALKEGVLNADRLAMQRQEHLNALASLAASLTAEQRAVLYPTALDAAEGNLDGSAGDEDDGMHPYDRSGINWGTTTLRYAGLRAAAALSDRPEQIETLATLALIQLPHADEDEALTLTQALAMLDPDHTGLPVEALAAHSLPWVRVLAARMWCAAREGRPVVGASLARDPSHHVRRTMAACLTDTELHTSLRLDLRHDPRRSVRRAAGAS